MKLRLQKYPMVAMIPELIQMDRPDVHVYRSLMSTKAHNIIGIFFF